jgi:hypothetical protein
MVMWLSRIVMVQTTAHHLPFPARQGLHCADGPAETRIQASAKRNPISCYSPAIGERISDDRLLPLLWCVPCFTIWTCKTQLRRDGNHEMKSLLTLD